MNMDAPSHVRPFIERLTTAPRGGGFHLPDEWVWCGSVIAGPDGRYYMFASVWAKGLCFSPHWLTNSRIVCAVADQPQGPYAYAYDVLPPRGEAYWDGRMTHNPAIVKYQDHYLLIYTGTTYTGPTPTVDAPLVQGDPADMTDHDARILEAHRNQRIGMATATSLTGPWTRLDQPILEPRPGQWDGLITTNPAPCLTPEGQLRIIYKSVASKPGDRMYLGIAGTDDPLNQPLRRLRDEPLFRADEIGDHVEDPFVWFADGQYHMIMKVMNGKLGGEKRAGIYLRSENGLDWPIDVHNVPRAWSRTVQWDDGTIRTQSFLERPHVLIQDGRETHFFAATAVGSDHIGQIDDSWNMVIELKN